MRTLTILLTFFILPALYAQDTLKVMQYNLLYYGVTTDFCTASNNNINKKDEYLKTIVNHTRPDILTVNEMSSSPAVHQHLLDQVLNTGGIYYYRKADFKSVAESQIVNMLFYNSNKLVLKNHLIVQSFLRDIDLYELYYRSNDLESGDTAFIICVVGHLKAGTGTSNENYRKIMAENTMDFLEEYKEEANYLLMGDFNVYSAGEPAYQEFLNYNNPSLRFQDPENAYGNWHSNFAFRNHHTQSTSESSNGCKSGGGSDDRFDFILTSASVMEGTRSVKYIDDSYQTIGQDGNHFNTSINALPINTSVPYDVLSALVANSDHLPVVLDLEIDKILDIYTTDRPDKLRIAFANPVSGMLHGSLQMDKPAILHFEILDMMGRVHYEVSFMTQQGMNRITIPLTKMRAGNYLLRITDEMKNSRIKKLMIL
ncbi:MAG: T9SS type A sorting domain-containing protein [bacterium]